jgi:hypothetical protein
MSNLETILNQIEALKLRESQVRAADTKTFQQAHEVRAALAAVRQELENLRVTKTDAVKDKAWEYRQMIDKLRAFVSTALPATAKVLVISRGDNELMNLGRECWHFPQVEGGGYAGHYPADSQAAIAHLEDLRAKTANYLLIPGTATWWLTHYVDFHRHLESRYLRIRSDETCMLYGLSAPSTASSALEVRPPHKVAPPVAPAPELLVPQSVAARADAVNGHHQHNGRESQGIVLRLWRRFSLGRVSR